MTISASGWLRGTRFFISICLLFLVLSWMSGCASTNAAAGPGEARHEIVTASDETDLRKRARIRLELAVGYFEQGQTKIALDELKQSLAADPGYAAAYNLRGLIYMRLNDYPFAEQGFRKALSINPRDANVMHNLGWLLCQQGKYAESSQLFLQALSNPQYGERAKTYLTLGLCQVKAGLLAEAEANLMRSYELDAGNPITAFNLTSLLYQRQDFVRAQFYIRRLNNTELANAESLWLGVKVEHQLKNQDAMMQLATQLEKRFSGSREVLSFQRGAFDE